MALKVTVSTGKPEVAKGSVGLVKQATEATKNEKPQVTVQELVTSLLNEVRAGLEKEADIEMELFAHVELSNKDGETVLHLDVGSDSPTARTLKLKFTTKVQPNGTDK
jgi:nucleoid DNA-binding protein